MAEQDGAHGFLDAAAIAFLARRLHNRRLRAAAVRGAQGHIGGGRRGCAGGRRSCRGLLGRYPFVDWPRPPPTSRPRPRPVKRSPCRACPSSSWPSARAGTCSPSFRSAAGWRSGTACASQPTGSSERMVEQAGLEFYPLAGDPHELMEYMVKTGGRIIPTRLDQIVEDVPKKRAMIAEILASTWRACTEADPDRPNAPGIPGRRHSRQPAQLRPHPLCRGTARPTAHDLHDAVESHVRLPASVRRHRPRPAPSGAELPVLLAGGPARLERHRRPGERVPPGHPEAVAHRARRTAPALLEDNEVPFTYLWPAAPGAQAGGLGPEHRPGEFHLPRAGTHLRAAGRAGRLPRRGRSADLRRVRLGRSSRTQPPSPVPSSRRSKRPARAASYRKAGRISAARQSRPTSF